MHNSTSTKFHEHRSRSFIDAETGELFHSVYEDIEIVRSKTGSETTTRLVVEPTGVSSGTNSDYSGIKSAIPRFVLSYKTVWQFFGDLRVSQYEKAVFRILIENMGYQNKVQIRQSVIASELSIGRPDVSKAVKSLKEKGLIVESKPNKLIPDIPVLRIDPRMVFAGQDKQMKRATAVFNAAWVKEQKNPPAKLVRVK